MIRSTREDVRPSHRRHDIPVHPEKVRRVVGTLQRDQPVVGLLSIRNLHPVAALVVEEVLAGTETERIYLPRTVEALGEADPEGATAALGSDHLALRT